MDILITDLELLTKIHRIITIEFDKKITIPLEDIVDKLISLDIIERNDKKWNVKVNAEELSEVLKKM